MTERFSIFSETNDYESLLPKHAILKGHKKKALGDVGNTIQTAPTSKGKGLLSSSHCAILQKEYINSKNPVLKKHALPDNDALESDDVCEQCKYPEEDTYEDIRPLSARLNDEDVDVMIQNLWRPSQREFFPRSPSPTFDFINESSYEEHLFLKELEEFKSLTLIDLDDDYLS